MKKIVSAKRRNKREEEEESPYLERLERFYNYKEAVKETFTFVAGRETLKAQYFNVY